MASDLQELKNRLEAQRHILRERFKVKRIGIFGSFSRGEQGAQSDIDVVVEFSEPIGWEIADLKEFLEELFGKEVDLVTPEALRREFREAVLKEAVFV